MVFERVANSAAFRRVWYRNVPSNDRRDKQSSAAFAHTRTMSSTATQASAVPITADNILRLFPDIDTSGEALDGHDEEQVRLMDEVCIVTDENDKPIGTASKKLCKSP